MLRIREIRYLVIVPLLVMGILTGILAGGVVRAAPAGQATSTPVPPGTVLISEVAWSGTKVDSSAEWIELHNPGSNPVSKDRWRLTSNPGSINIFFSNKTIPAGGYFLLGRYSASIFSDITPDMLFPDPLVDTGAVLTLYDPAGNVVDTANKDMVAGSGWRAGTASPDYFSMERIGTLPDGAGAWASNDGIIKYGHDSSGNPINGTPGQPNSTPPSVTITSAAPNPTNVSPIPITFTFSEAVTGFASTNINVGNGTLGNLTGSGTTYTADVTPAADGPVTVDVAAGAATGTTTGKGSVAAIQFSITYDTTPPTVGILGPASSTTSTSPIPITFTFSEPVTGFVVGDILVGNGIAGNFAGSGTTYTADVTPTTSGTVTVAVSAGVAADAAGNGNTAATQFTINYDAPPTVTITSTAANPTSTSPIPVTFTFSEAVTGFVVGDITVGNGTAGNFVTVSSSVYTASITPTAMGTVTVDVDTGVAIDAAGNNNVAAVQFLRSYEPLPTATPTAPTHIVISELRSRGWSGIDGSADEFIELYNPTGGSVNIGDWIIKKSSSCSTSDGQGVTNLVVIFRNTVLLAGQHYLVAATGSSVTGANQTYPASLPDDGGVALVTVGGAIVDEVGMCATTRFHEGTSLPPLTGLSDQSYERKPGGNTGCYDTNNNAADFALISTANPQNKSIPTVMCAGVLTYTPTPAPANTPTRTPTRLPNPPGIVVINEFLPHPATDWNGDGMADTGDEYIELMNVGTESVNLKNWKLDNGFGGSSPFTLPDVTLLPRQMVVFYHIQSGIGLSDGGSSVRLLRPDGRTADIYNYPVVSAADRTWCRLPDGTGTWAFVCRPTPGMPNKHINSAAPVPGSTPGAEAHRVIPPVCLMDNAPQAVLSAECNSPGTGIWGEAGSGEVWLESHLKWEVFVE